MRSRQIAVAGALSRLLMTGLAVLTVLPAQDVLLAPQRGYLESATPLKIEGGDVAPLRRIEPVNLDAVNPVITGDGCTILLRLDLPGDRFRIHFTNIHLPPASRLYLYGTDDKSSVTGSHDAFEGSGPVATGDFWSHPLSGTVYAELRSGAGCPPDLPFTITEIQKSNANFVQQGNVRPFEGIEAGVYGGTAVTYAIRGGDAVYEGDIELGPAALMQKAETLKQGAKHSATGVSSWESLWPNGVIPFAIDSTIPNPERITDAISHWNGVMGGTVALVPRTSEPNYVQFVNAADAGRCSSYVGMARIGAQSLWVGGYCSTGNVIHEIGHAFGLWHEHTRNDRDSYVKILWENILSAQAYNFQVTGVGGTDIGPYDFNSIMHYPSWAFSANGASTIETIPAGIPIGQQNGLSSGDVEGIRTLYSAKIPTGPMPAVSFTVSTNPSGIVYALDEINYSGITTMQWTAGSAHTIAAPQTSITTGVRSTFVSWSDGGKAAHAILVPPAPTVLTASYTREYQVTATAGRGGSVLLAPFSQDGFYPEMSSVTAKALPDDGFCFASWSGLIAGTPSSTTLSVQKVYALTANFRNGRYSTPRRSDVYTQSGGAGSITVQTDDGCAWSAQSLDSWITLDGSIRVGNGSIQYSVAPNPTNKARTGRIAIAGSTYRVAQEGN